MVIFNPKTNNLLFHTGLSYRTLNDVRSVCLACLIGLSAIFQRNSPPIAQARKKPTPDFPFQEVGFDIW